MKSGDITPVQRGEMVGIVLKRLGKKKANLWWQTPNPMLGDVAPMEMVLMGREAKLYQFIKSLTDDPTCSPKET